MNKCKFCESPCGNKHCSFSNPKNTVFIIMSYDKYCPENQGEFIVEIWDNEEKAKKRIKKLEKNNQFDGFYIYNLELNKERDY